MYRVSLQGHRIFRSCLAASTRACARPLFARYSHYDATATAAKTTLPKLFELWRQGTPLTCVTAHDAISARLADLAGMDIVLVGDSLAMVAMGYDDTREIELDDMIYHTKAVRRGAKSPFIIADLPFGSYERSLDQACESALRMVKVGGAECVKFEGGAELAPIVEKLANFGIATMPHIGLKPQRQVSAGGFKVQGRTAEAAEKVWKEAHILKDAGATMFLIEGVPDRVAAEITKSVGIPTIGIGAGAGTSGQVLVQLDLLGGFDAFVPKFLKRYSDYLGINVAALKQYRSEVICRQFPNKDHSYAIKDAEFNKFLQKVAQK